MIEQLCLLLCNVKLAHMQCQTAIATPTPSPKFSKYLTPESDFDSEKREDSDSDFTHLWTVRPNRLQETPLLE